MRKFRAPVICAILRDLLQGRDRSVGGDLEDRPLAELNNLIGTTIQVSSLVHLRAFRPVMMCWVDRMSFLQTSPWPQQQQSGFQEQPTETNGGGKMDKWQSWNCA